MMTSLTMKITSCGVRDTPINGRNAVMISRNHHYFPRITFFSLALNDALNKFLFSGTQYEKGMEALSSMDRVKQMEAIQGYNSMKSNLMEYLKKFAENGKVVRQEDIQEFFQQMQAAKRPRVEIPKFCK